MPNKLLTVSIAAYNVEKYLPQILPTFLNTSILSDIEILLIDDGSRDKTAEIASTFEKAYPQTIKLVSKENGGHGSTINTAIKCAAGTYFKVVDGDDWVDTDAFCHFIEKLKRRDEDLILSPFNTVDDATGVVIGQMIYDELHENRTYSLDALKEIKLAMHALTFKTSILRKIRPISEHCFYVDIEYILYPLPFVKSVAYIREPVYQYRFGREGQSMLAASMQKNREMHLRVTDNIIGLYKENGTNPQAYEIIKKRLMELCETQMYIYYNMPVSRETKMEADAFIKHIQKEIPELCDKIQRKDIRILVMTKGKLYWPTAWIYHRIMLWREHKLINIFN